MRKIAIIKGKGPSFRKWKVANDAVYEAVCNVVLQVRRNVYWFERWRPTVVEPPIPLASCPVFQGFQTVSYDEHDPHYDPFFGRQRAEIVEAGKPEKQHELGQFLPDQLSRSRPREAFGGLHAKR